MLEKDSHILGSKVIKLAVPIGKCGAEFAHQQLALGQQI